MNKKEKYLQLLKLRNDLIKNRAMHKGYHQNVDWVIKELEEQLKQYEKNL